MVVRGGGAGGYSVNTCGAPHRLDHLTSADKSSLSLSLSLSLSHCAKGHREIHVDYFRHRDLFGEWLYILTITTSTIKNSFFCGTTTGLKRRVT